MAFTIANFRPFPFPFQSIVTWVLYAAHCVDCPEHSVAIQQVPWNDGNRPVTIAMMCFLSRWAQWLSRRESGYGNPIIMRGCMGLVLPSFECTLDLLSHRRESSLGKRPLRPFQILHHITKLSSHKARIDRPTFFPDVLGDRQKFCWKVVWQHIKHCDRKRRLTQVSVLTIDTFCGQGWPRSAHLELRAGLGFRRYRS